MSDADNKTITISRSHRAADQMSRCDKIYQRDQTRALAGNMDVPVRCGKMSWLDNMLKRVKMSQFIGKNERSIMPGRNVTLGQYDTSGTSKYLLGTCDKMEEGGHNVTVTRHPPLMRGGH